jgi:hypothetical protein
VTNEEKIEQRLAALESAVAELQRQIAPKPSDGNSVARFTGAFKDDPVFEEIV